MQHYFLDELMHVFTWDAVSPECIKNGLELTIFRLAKQEPASFPELFPSTVAVPARTDDPDPGFDVASGKSDESEDLMIFDD